MFSGPWQVSPKYFRPTEVETLLGDPKKASEKLGWCLAKALRDFGFRVWDLRPYNLKIFVDTPSRTPRPYHKDGCFGFGFGG